MGGIQWKRVVLGGLVAGVAYNVLGVVSASISGLPDAFARVGLEPSAGVALLHTALRFVLGIASVALYAAVRPRFGPGFTAAAKVGLFVWIIGYVTMSTILQELGVLGVEQYAFALGWGLFEAIAATAAGAWLYREPTG